MATLIKNIPLTEFMKALGQEQPIYADGIVKRYNAPYRQDNEASMIVNSQTNSWRDVKTGAYGGIYDLAYEMTESCSMSVLNKFISEKMSDLNFNAL